MNCDMCGREISESSEYSDTTIRAKISIDIIDYCDKCKQRHDRTNEFYFCSPDCLIEFSSKKLMWLVIRMRNGK